MIKRAIFQLILILGLVGCGNSLAQDEFVSEFGNDVNIVFSDFEYWDEIQTSEVGEALHAYINESFARESGSVQLDVILRIIEAGGLLGISVEAHERWEVLAFLNNGYTLGNIGTEKTYREFRAQAHAVARYKELRFYQFLYEYLFNDFPPAMKACLAVSPVLKIFVEDLYGIHIDVFTLNNKFDDLLGFKRIVLSEPHTRDDIDKCMRLFDAMGVDYGAEREIYINRAYFYLKNHS